MTLQNSRGSGIGHWALACPILGWVAYNLSAYVEQDWGPRVVNAMQHYPPSYYTYLSLCTWSMFILGIAGLALGVLAVCKSFSAPRWWVLMIIEGVVAFLLSLPLLGVAAIICSR
jgi:hypothetical protein